MIFSLKEKEDCPVRGHLKMLDDVRLVFIGEDADHPELMYLGFRNQEGEDTKLTLSKEAYQALRNLMNEPFKGRRVRFPYKLSWKVEIITDA